MNKVSVLFACLGNTCRSQMAEGFARKISDFPIDINSAGTKPADHVNPLAIEVMKEVGIDISQNKPKIITTKTIKETTHFISMGCGVEDACPVPLFSVSIEDWELEDPAGQDISVFRKVRDQIQTKVQDLMKRLKTLSI